MKKGEVAKISQVSYTPEEVKDLFKKFMEDTDFVVFAEEFGVKGWDELDMWLEQNVG